MHQTFSPRLFRARRCRWSRPVRRPARGPQRGFVDYFRTQLAHSCHQRFIAELGSGVMQSHCGTTPHRAGGPFHQNAVEETPAGPLRCGSGVFAVETDGVWNTPIRSRLLFRISARARHNGCSPTALPLQERRRSRLLLPPWGITQNQQPAIPCLTAHHGAATSRRLL